ncbi:MAG TPA: TIGR03619 family F420-dependent LLM class oxidoreductase [Acidimicrobiales bacterium]|nr:TIGR03619 family F420-dependent LLM class oxidoreductase [Acidimicrobiales bacterium]
MPVTLGIVTPVLHMNPRFDPPEWEVTASVNDVVSVVQMAEALGYDWVACSEHIAIPAAASTARGGRYWDPFSTLGFLAAKTTTIGLLTHMAVLPYHHPLELVKRLGTLDLLSEGRVIAGVGVGSLQAEFDVLGHRFEGRGDQSDDAIAALRAAWGTRVPEYHGTHYDFEGFIVEPSGLPRPLPVWVGGRTKRSLRRALALGDAWMPFGYRLEELSAVVSDPAIRQSLADYADEHGRGLQLIFAPEPPVNPLDDPEGTASFLAAYVAIGATGFSLRFEHHSMAHYCEQMEAMQAVVAQLGGDVGQPGPQL